jgi:hypothetical protein
MTAPLGKVGHHGDDEDGKHDHSEAEHLQPLVHVAAQREVRHHDQPTRRRDADDSSATSAEDCWEKAGQEISRLPNSPITELWLKYIA